MNISKVSLSGVSAMALLASGLSFASPGEQTLQKQFLLQEYRAKHPLVAKENIQVEYRTNLKAHSLRNGSAPVRAVQKKTAFAVVFDGHTATPKKTFDTYLKTLKSKFDLDRTAWGCSGAWAGTGAEPAELEGNCFIESKFPDDEYESTIFHEFYKAMQFLIVDNVKFAAQPVTSIMANYKVCLGTYDSTKPGIASCLFGDTFFAVDPKFAFQWSSRSKFRGFRTLNELWVTSRSLANELLSGDLERAHLVIRETMNLNDQNYFSNWRSKFLGQNSGLGLGVYFYITLLDGTTLSSVIGDSVRSCESLTTKCGIVD